MCSITNGLESKFNESFSTSSKSFTNIRSRKTNKKTTTRFNTKGNTPDGSVPPQKSKLDRIFRNSLDRKVKLENLSSGKQPCGISTRSRLCFSLKYLKNKSALPTESETRAPPLPTKGGIDERAPKTAPFKVDHHLWELFVWSKVSCALALCP